MKTKKPALTLCIVLVFASFAWAETPGITGNSYLTWPKEIRVLYLQAFSTGWIAYLSVYDGKKQKGNWFAAGNMPFNQMDDILTKYLKENPEKRNQDVSFLIIKCFFNLYRKQPHITKEELESLKRDLNE